MCGRWGQDPYVTLSGLFSVRGSSNVRRSSDSSPNLYSDCLHEPRPVAELIRVPSGSQTIVFPGTPKVSLVRWTSAERSGVETVGVVAEAEGPLHPPCRRPTRVRTDGWRAVKFIHLTGQSLTNGGERSTSRTVILSVEVSGPVRRPRGAIRPGRSLKQKSQVNSRDIVVVFLPNERTLLPYVKKSGNFG